MPFLLFVDALPFSYIDSYKPIWADGLKYSQLTPNIGYSSNLHWQLFFDLYPDQVGFFTDWSYMPEQNKIIVAISSFFRFADKLGNFGVLLRKGLDRIVFRKNAFANIPFRFRSKFSEYAKYLFFDDKYVTESELYHDYKTIFQDQLKTNDQETLKILEEVVESKESNIFASLGFVDFLGHKLSRGNTYNAAIDKIMGRVRTIIDRYLEIHKDGKLLIVSDHGMSNIKYFISNELDFQVGKQSVKTYLAYLDSCIMRVYVFMESLKNQISTVLENSKNGHLLSEAERVKFGVTNRKFGDYIFILYDGNVYKDNWFGKSIRKKSKEFGMHGFWPGGVDHQAVIMTNSEDLLNTSVYNYQDAHKLIKEVMNNHDN